MLQPSERPLNSPSIPVMESIAFCQMSQRFITALDERTDQADPQTFEPSAERIAVRRFVIDQPRPPWKVDGRCRDQLFDQSDLVGRGAVDRRMQRDTFPIRQQLNLGSLAGLGGTDGFAPFFPGINVASPKRVLRSNWRKLSLSSTIRCQARCRTPVSVHNLNLWWQTLLEGSQLGKSFQRQPVKSTNRIPSRQSRLEWEGRPPSGRGCGAGKSSSIKNHWSSLSCAEGSFLDPDSVSCPGSVRDRWAMRSLLSEDSSTRSTCQSVH